MGDRAAQPGFAEALCEAWRMLDDAPARVARDAENLARRAPKTTEIVVLLAAARRRTGNVSSARDVLRPVMTEQVASPIAWFEWGLLLCETDQAREAIEALTQAVARAPHFGAAWRSMGDQFVVLGEGDAAWQAYAGAARAEERDNAGLAAMAAALADGRMAEVERNLHAPMLQEAADPRALRLYGQAALQAGHPARAEAALRRCLARRPEFAEARHCLAILLYGQRRFADAAIHFRILLERLPHQPCLQLLLATSLVESGDFAAEVPLYESMLARFYNRPKILLNYGHALKALGREAQSAAAYRACIALSPEWQARACLALADLKTVKLSAAETARMQGSLARGLAAPDYRAQMHFALGSALEGHARYEEAFTHFADGATLRRAEICYDPALTTAHAAAAISLLTKDFFAARQGAGCLSDAPIFIVGLPRSGSTLVEQILASHSQVEATAELEDIGGIAADLCNGRPAPDLAKILHELGKSALAQHGERYMTATRQFRRLGRARFIDKMPHNFLHAGLLQLILPQACIVDVRRSAMPAGFAAFKQFFQPWQTGMDFSYDLSEIGLYYRDYVGLMAHFDAVLPGRVFHLRYEDLVLQPEHHIRKLLAHCNLPFEPACLRFWETERPIQTPSALQVRRPITRAGLDHWHHFAPWLDPLRRSLGVLADA